MLAKMQILLLCTPFTAGGKGVVPGILSLIGSVCFFLSSCMDTCSGHYLHSQTARLRHNALHHALEWRSAQPCLGVLDLRDLPNVLQADFANRPLICIARRSAVERRLALRLRKSAVRPCYVAGAADLVLGGFDACCGEE
jgi:hypothetical protein